MVSLLSVSTLRTHLLNALLALPGCRIFDIHVLVSSQRKPNESLFPYCSPKPKSLMQEVLVLLSEQTVTTNDTDKTFSPPVFVTAIEVDVFFFPGSSSTILYVSKVDGTGQGAYPSPTSTLVNALLQFYASPSSPIYPTNRNHTLWIHLFARAQRQYLFPNSADYPDKKPLGDVALCKWWKTSLGKIASDTQNALESLDSTRKLSLFSMILFPVERSPSEKERIKLSTRLFYLIPGQTELEATYSLGIGNGSFAESQWIYSHPYDVHKDLDIPFVSASPGSGSKENHLPSLIPYFDDDPKSRFLDELVTTSEEKTVAVPTPTPRRKRRRVDSNSNHDDSTSISEPRSTIIAQPTIKMPQPQRLSPPAIAFIPPSSSPPHFENDEPVERPSTPEPNLEEQTLVAPQTPQYPRLTTQLLSSHTPSPSNSREVQLTPHTPHTKLPKSPHTPKASRRPKSDLDNVSTTEFWERMSFRQECAQGAVTGFFVAIFDQKNISDGKPVSNSNESAPSILVDGTVPHTVLKRVMTSLVTGVEFSTAERSYKSTQTIQTAIKGLCDGLRDTSSSVSEGEKLSIPEDNTGIYSRHVYASLTINNLPLLRKPPTGSSAVNGGASVNILGVRRKKKRD